MVQPCMPSSALAPPSGQSRPAAQCVLPWPPLRPALLAHGCEICVTNLRRRIACLARRWSARSTTPSGWRWWSCCCWLAPELWAMRMPLLKTGRMLVQASRPRHPYRLGSIEPPLHGVSAVVSEESRVGHDCVELAITKTCKTIRYAKLSIKH